MPSVQHSSLTGNQLHEPKGAASANVDEVYVANGSGSGEFQLLNPYGGILYNDVDGSGTTFTTPASYTLLNPTTTATNLKSFSTNGSGRLTYTGPNGRHFHGVVDMSFKHTVGTGQDCFFTVYKNGSQLGSFEVVVTADSVNFQRVVLHFDTAASTDNFFEIYCKTASGSIEVYHMYLFMMGMPG